MTIYDSVKYEFDANVDDSMFTTYDPQTSPDGQYRGDGSELLPDTRKIYDCRRDYSIQDTYKIEQHGYLFLKKDDVIYRNKKWYRVKQDIDISMDRKGNYGGVTIFHWVQKRIRIQRVDYITYAKGDDGQTTTTTKSGKSYVDGNGVPHTVEDHFYEHAVVNNSLVKYRVTYFIKPIYDSDGNQTGEKAIETYREKVETLASAPYTVIDTNYQTGEQFLVFPDKWDDISDEDYASHFFIREIVSLSSLPSYDNEDYFEPLLMWTNIAVEYDFLPSWRVTTDDGKLYNTVIKDGNTEYELNCDDSIDGVFLGEAIGDKILIEFNDNTEEIILNKDEKDVKFYKFKYPIRKLKITLVGSKTGIGMILVGRGKRVGRTNENYSMIPRDNSIYKEHKGGFIEYIEGKMVYDYESVIREYQRNRAYLFDTIKQIKQKICGFDFDENSSERYTKTVGRLLVKGINDKKEKERDENSFGIEIPFVVRSSV